MSNEKYTFTDYTIRSGMQSYVELNKWQVWDSLKHDKDFFGQRLYEIKVKFIDHTTGMGGYTWPGREDYRNELHWARNITEAKKIGEVLKQVYPQAVDYRKQRSVRAKTQPSKKASSS